MFGVFLLYFLDSINHLLPQLACIFYISRQYLSREEKKRKRCFLPIAKAAWFALTYLNWAGTTSTSAGLKKRRIFPSWTKSLALIWKQIQSIRAFENADSCWHSTSWRRLRSLRHFPERKKNKIKHTYNQKGSVVHSIYRTRTIINRYLAITATVCNRHSFNNFKGVPPVHQSSKKSRHVTKWKIVETAVNNDVRTVPICIRFSSIPCICTQNTHTKIAESFLIQFPVLKRRNMNFYH